jgi:alpha-L-fucosidase
LASAGGIRKAGESFNPSHFNADAIIRMARDAGMQYVVFTAKHHEGFAMFSTKADRYNVLEATPWARDPARELRKACDRYGLKLCFYYSQAQDWHHPDGIEENVPDEPKNFRKYLDGKCIPQITELLTNYGEVGLIWFDTPMSMTKEQSEELRALVKTLQPDCLISGRIGNALGDYMTTGDNFIPLLAYPGDFEVPATINDTWGFNRYDHRWKSPGEAFEEPGQSGQPGREFPPERRPDAEGVVPEESVRVLKVLGGFLEKCGESVYGTHTVPTYPYDIDWGYFTSRPGKLYIHVFEDLPEVYLLNMANKPRRATLLSDGRELTLRERVTCEGDHSWRILWPNGEKPKRSTP